MAMSEDHASCWVYKDLTVMAKQIQVFVDGSEGVGRKGRMSNTNDRYRAGILEGKLGGYSFKGTVTAGDGSNQTGGKMGAGHVNLRKKSKKQQRKVGREEEGSSSNRSELVAFVLALHSTPVTTPMLYFCDNQALLKAVKRWECEGGKVID